MNELTSQILELRQDINEMTDLMMKNQILDVSHPKETDEVGVIKDARIIVRELIRTIEAQQ